MNWKTLNQLLVKWQFFFKTLSFENGLSYWALLGLEWKMFCHSLLICSHFCIGYCRLAAIIMVRCPYIYFQDSISSKENPKFYIMSNMIFIGESLHKLSIRSGVPLAKSLKKKKWTHPRFLHRRPKKAVEQDSDIHFDLTWAKKIRNGFLCQKQLFFIKK